MKCIVALAFAGFAATAHAEVARLDFTRTLEDAQFNMWDDSFPVSQVRIKLPKAGLEVSVVTTDGDPSPAICDVTTRLILEGGRVVARELVLTPELEPEEGALCTIIVKDAATGRKATVTVESIGT